MHATLAPQREQVDEDFRALIDLAPDAVFLARLSGQLIYANEAACALSDYARSELLGLPIDRLLAVKWPGTGKEGLEAPWQRGRLDAVETRLRRADGSWLEVEVNARVLAGGKIQAWVRDISRRATQARCIENGEITGAIVVNEDTTLLHEAQEKQRAGEELLRTVFNLLPVGLWIVDREGKITFANPAAEHMWSGDHYVGPAHHVAYKAWWVETGEPIADEEWALARALQGETSHSELIRIQCFDGSTKTMMNWATPIRSGTGEIIGAIAANEDVTSLQYTQEQLRSAVRERERILAVVAHDLRNPLAALRAHAAVVDLAARRLPGGEKVVAQAALIVDIGRRMSGLVNDLLSIGAAGAGGHHMLALSPVSPASLLARAADAVRPLMAGKDLALEIKPADKLPALRADVDRILRVLGNLLDNALKFTAPQGRVSMAAKSTTAGILFTVANSGPAVEATELEVMFQPFWQAQSDRAGTGLGLAICRSIVEAHGGTIWAEPAGGQRLRVCFVLPRA